MGAKQKYINFYFWTTQIKKTCWNRSVSQIRLFFCGFESSLPVLKLFPQQFSIHVNFPNYFSIYVHFPKHFSIHVHFPKHFSIHVHFPKHFIIHINFPKHFGIYVHIPKHLSIHVHFPKHFIIHVHFPKHFSINVHFPKHFSVYIHFYGFPYFVIFMRMTNFTRVCRFLYIQVLLCIILFWRNSNVLVKYL